MSTTFSSNGKFRLPCAKEREESIDPSKAMAELGWAPTTMFADGYKNHMDWMATTCRQFE